jgi:hypothetical protein
VYKTQARNSEIIDLSSYSSSETQQEISAINFTSSISLQTISFSLSQPLLLYLIAYLLLSTSLSFNNSSLAVDFLPNLAYIAYSSPTISHAATRVLL